MEAKYQIATAVYSPVRRKFEMPAVTKILDISNEYDHDSESVPSYPTKRSTSCVNGAIDNAICADFSSEMCRQDVSRSMSATLPLASAASFSSFAARASARWRNSELACDDLLPKWISQYTPIVIRQVASTVPQFSTSSLMWYPSDFAVARAISRTKPATTPQAPNSARDSLVATSDLNWSSVLPISPYRRCGKGPPLTLAVLLGASLAGLLFLVSWWLG